MTNPMIERVAKALIEALKSECDRYGDWMRDEEDGTIQYDGNFDIGPLARAALEALREPTEAMVMAGMAVNDRKAYDTESSKASRCIDIINAFPAMIDAALKEE